MKAAILLVFAAATAVLAEEIFLETPIDAGLRRSPKIVGGSEAVPHSIPFQVAVISNNLFCGGSLITRRYVVTAAHCGVRSRTPNIIMGAHKIREKEPEQVAMIARGVKNHENYQSQTLRNDISVVELPQEAPINKNIQTVKLVSPNAGLLVGARAQASGWGLAYDGAPGISPVLRVVESTIMTNADCNRKFGSQIQIFDSVICLDGSQRKSTCNGDSGGPLVIRNGNEFNLIGVVSFGSSAGCEKGYPAGFSRITYFHDWIKRNTNYQ